MGRITISIKRSQKLDKTAIERYGVPSIILMENAGRSVAYEIIRQIGKKRNSIVCVVCGLGNNAGDGFVVARHLLNAGIRTKIFLIGDGGNLKKDAAVNYSILKKLEYPFYFIGAKTAGGVNIFSDAGYRALINNLSKADIVVDAIFGSGLNREILSPFKEIIAIVNKKAKRVVAVDTPSGLDGTTGNIYGACINADTTVTFNFAKEGFFKNKGPGYVGNIVVVDIGIPLKLKNRFIK